MINGKMFFALWAPRLLSVLRIVTALLFMQHGSQKIFGIPPLPSGISIDLLSLAGIAGLMEFFGGMLILFGVFTRPVAFILSGEMAVAYFKSHAPQGFWPVLNRGELAVAFCFIFLYLAVAGGGVWSIDERLRRRKSEDSYDSLS